MKRLFFSAADVQSFQSAMRAGVNVFTVGRIIWKWLWKWRIMCKCAISSSHCLSRHLALYSDSAFFSLSPPDNKQCHRFNPVCDAVSLLLFSPPPWTHKKGEAGGTSLNAFFCLFWLLFFPPFPSDYRVGEHLQIRVPLFLLSSSWQNDKANLLIRSSDRL